MVKKTFLVLVFSFIVFGIILSSIGVFAGYGDNSGKSGKSDNSDSSGSSDTSVGVETKTDSKGNSGKGDAKARAEIRQEIREEVKEEMKDKLREERIRIKESFDKIKTEIKIEQKEEGNRTKVEIELSDGRKKEIKVMPDRASETALAVLKDSNYSLVLKEIKDKKNGSKAVYYIVSNETGRLFGIFKTRVKVETEIDPETGNITRYKKRWWSVFVFGEDKKVVICHIPKGNVNNSHTIVVGAPAVRAHLNHGDRIGSCSAAPMNNTNITNPGNNNTNFTIPPINNTNITIPTNNTNVTIPPQNDTNSSIGNSTNSTDGNSSIEVNLSVNISS